MYNFVINNLNLIKRFNKLYEKEINIQVIFDYIKNECCNVNVEDYIRFRVFLDLCLMLLNMEKVGKIYGGNFSYKDYIRDCITINRELLLMIKNCSLLAKDKDEIKLYYSFFDKRLNEWDQMCIIRDAFAHSQFGQFETNGKCILTFGIFNKDRGEKKNLGIVIEPLFHEVVRHFFSNYSYGLLLKYTVFSNYSLKNDRNVDGLLFYDITLNNEGKETVDSFENNVLSKLVWASKQNKLFDCIKENRGCLNINEDSVERLISIAKFEKIALNYKINNAMEDFIYAIKLFLSTSEVLSNFIAHIVHIVDTIYKYKVEGNVIDNDLYGLLEPLQEDRYSKFSFDFGFIYIELVNLLIRLQDTDYGKLPYDSIDISGFKFDEEKANEYFDKVNMTDEIYKKEKFVLMRVRNAVMHGNFKLEMGEMDYKVVFVDKYNNREEIIEITFSSLKNFLNQNSLYSTMSIFTDLVIFNKIN